MPQLRPIYSTDMCDIIAFNLPKTARNIAANALPEHRHPVMFELNGKAIYIPTMQQVNDVNNDPRCRFIQDAWANEARITQLRSGIYDKVYPAIYKIQATIESAHDTKAAKVAPAALTEVKTKLAKLSGNIRNITDYLAKILDQLVIIEEKIDQLCDQHDEQWRDLMRQIVLENVKNVLELKEAKNLQKKQSRETEEVEHDLENLMKQFEKQQKLLQEQQQLVKQTIDVYQLSVSEQYINQTVELFQKRQQQLESTTREARKGPGTSN